MMLYSSHMKRTALFIGTMSLVLMGAGCGSSTTATPDGGVYRTIDYGKTWTQPSALIVGAKVGSIANVNAISATLDPQDPEVMYVGTSQNGLLETLDGSQSWEQARGLSTGSVTAVAVDQQNKCVVYAARANQIFKTETCGRDWVQVYFDPRTAQVYTALAVDPINTKTIYAGNIDGDILRSDSGGASWSVIYRAEAGINSVLIDPRDSKTMYVSTNGAGLLKTVDRGTTWTEINAQLDQYQGARRPLMVVMEPGSSKNMYLVARNSLLRSDDAGATWRALALPTPTESTNIRAFAIHPKNANLLVYSTDTSVVFTADGGQTWTPKKLPTSRASSFLMFDQGPNNALFVGTVVKK